MASKVINELSQSNENTDIKKERYATYKRKIRRVLKGKKLDSKVLPSQYIRSTDSLLVKKTRCYVC
jgi:hypothetical protein